jgi:hypothetical protein
MKATKAEIAQRVEAILEIRLAGAEFADIRKYATENGWPLSDSQLWRYIRKSDDILAHTLEQDRQKLLNRHLAQRHALYARAMSVSDYRTALAVLRDQAELQGLYPTGRNGPPGPETGSGGAAIEAVAMKIIQHITVNVPDRELSAEQLMLAARQLREQAAALSREAPSHDTNGQQTALPR